MGGGCGGGLVVMVDKVGGGRMVEVDGGWWVVELEEKWWRWKWRRGGGG